MLKKITEDDLPLPKTQKKQVSQPSNPTGKTKTDKEKLIMKIIKYQENKRFGDRIKKGLGMKYTRTQLLKCSIENLEAILYRIRTFLNNSNLDAVFEHMARYSAKSYEELVSNFYDIEGFSDLLLSNPAFWDNFERWKVEQEMPDIPPSFQMLYMIISTTYLAHLQNKVKKINNRPHKINEPKEIIIVDKDDKQTNPIMKKSKNKVGDIM